MSAVLTHAADLFAEQGPEATSIRTIAERAGVNHGLVFRHFGAKTNLVAAVLDYLSTQNAELDDDQLFSLDEPGIRRHWMVLARCILDGYPVGQMQAGFPIIARMMEAARGRHDNEQDAALAVGNAVALEFGWQMFEPFLRAATGLADLPAEQLRTQVDAEATRMVHGENGSLPAND